MGGFGPASLLCPCFGHLDSSHTLYNHSTKPVSAEWSRAWTWLRAVPGLWLDLKILEICSNLRDSRITSISTPQQQSHLHIPSQAARGSPWLDVLMDFVADGSLGGSTGLGCLWSSTCLARVNGSQTLGRANHAVHSTHNVHTHTMHTTHTTNKHTNNVQNTHTMHTHTIYTQHTQYTNNVKNTHNWKKPHRHT